MQDRYSLTRGQSRFCRLAAAVLWFAAAIAALMLPIFLFGIGGTALLECETDIGCTAVVDRIDLLPEDLQAPVRASPEAGAAYESHLRRPAIRLLLTLLVTLRILFYVAMFAFAAMALWRLGRRRGAALATAFPMLKRAALAATGVALLPPVIDSARGAIAAAGVPGEDRLYIEFAPDIEMLGLNILVALTLLSVAWALEAGTRAARDMDEIV